MSTILVTGGAGFIGSHTVVELIQAGHSPVIIDNLCNASPQVIGRITEITGHTPAFYQGDIRDRELLRRIFAEHPIQSVIHFAALKAVGESVKKPLEYYSNNVSGSLILLEEMQRAGVKSIVFSSSATVYGDPDTVPITETAPLGQATNPYGASKQMMERMMADLHTADPEWSVILLRYFNPVGAHESGRIGEDPSGIPNNLVPFIAQVAVGRREHLNVFGNDYPTVDGTGVRDYIHVVDLADGHLKALDYISEHGGLHTWNLGTGNGYSVLEVLHAFEKACGKELPYKIVARRPGDVAVSYADPSSALADLGWSASRDIDTMVRDHWNWQKNNPNGYDA